MQNYYDRETTGDRRWYTWFIVFWMMIVTWMVGQLALTAPFAPMLAELDPEAHAVFNNSMTNGMDMSVLAVIGLSMLFAFIGMIMGVIALMIHYLGARGKGSLVTGLIGVFMTLLAMVPFFWANGQMPAEGNAALMSIIGLSPIAYMLMLLTFPAALVGLYVGWRFVQERSITALHTAWSRFRWGRAIQAFLMMWIVLGCYGLYAAYFTDNPPRFVFDASRFLPYAILSLLLLPVQSATEEIAVRGFMNKGLINLLGNKWVAFVLTSGLFMALHLANPEAQAGAEAGNLPIVMSGYFFFGFAACLMVLIDNGLESAIGVHAANNTFAGIFINYENSVLPTPSIWQVRAEPTGDAVHTLIVLAVVLGLLYVTRKPKPADEHPPLVPQTPQPGNLQTTFD